MDISIIIPVYFNEGSIMPTYERLQKEVFGAFPELEFEVIFVDDGSADHSFEEIMRLKEMHNHITALQFTRNFGQVAAIYAGYEIARGAGIMNSSTSIPKPFSVLTQMFPSFI